MAGYFTHFGAIMFAMIAISWRWFLKDIIYDSVGFQREIQDISDFPYSCRKIWDPIAEGCEDMWIDNEKRVLYAVCAPTRGRILWTPSMSALNASGRSQKDHVLMLDLDHPGTDGKFNMKVLPFSGYKGPASATTIDTHGFDVDILDDNTLRFLMINHRPPSDESGSILLDAKKFGANSTVDFFEVERGFDATKLRWKRTVSDLAIYTPNNIASMGNGDFYVSNDKGAKTGLLRELFPLHSGGDIAYCPAEGPCKKASGNVGFKYANGLVRGSDKRIYVPSSWLAKWWVFEVEDDFSLKKVEDLKTAMPIDNLSVDEKGDIYAAGFPDVIQFTKTVPNPYKIMAPTTVWRIRRLVGSGGKVTYLQEKVVEDKEARGIGGATVAVHDARTGRLFLGGNYAPYISVCDKKDI